MNLAHKNKFKTVVFIDSLSAFNAIGNSSNSSWSIINKVKNIIRVKIKTFLIPGHIGLFGNEQADRATNTAVCASPIIDDIIDNLNLQRYIARKAKEKIIETIHLQYYCDPYSSVRTHLSTPYIISHKC